MFIVSYSTHRLKGSICRARLARAANLAFFYGTDFKEY